MTRRIQARKDGQRLIRLRYREEKADGQTATEKKTDGDRWRDSN